MRAASRRMAMATTGLLGRCALYGMRHAATATGMRARQWPEMKRSAAASRPGVVVFLAGLRAAAFGLQPAVYLAGREEAGHAVRQIHQHGVAGLALPDHAHDLLQAGRWRTQADTRHARYGGRSGQAEGGSGMAGFFKRVAEASRVVGGIGAIGYGWQADMQRLVGWYRRCRPQWRRLRMRCRYAPPWRQAGRRDGPRGGSHGWPAQECELQGVIAGRFVRLACRFRPGGRRQAQYPDQQGQVQHQREAERRAPTHDVAPRRPALAGGGMSR